MEFVVVQILHDHFGLQFCQLFKAFDVAREFLTEIGSRDVTAAVHAIFFNNKQLNSID